MAIEIQPGVVAAKQQRQSQILSQIQEPEVIQDYKLVGQLNQELQEITDFLDTYHKYNTSHAQLLEARSLLDDPEMAEMAKSEIEKLEEVLSKAETKLAEMLAFKLDDDEKSAIIEIRAGTGGAEAALFAEEIHRMYIRYLNSINFPVEAIHTSLEDTGGIKEVVFRVDKKGAFGHLRFESGVHRVQRVPVTEANGRIHTSAISVVVLPEVAATEVNIPQSDIRIDVYRSSGAGGQGVNRTDSAVRVTHIPTGIIVTCQDSRSQHRNKETAMGILASKLYNLQYDASQSKTKDLRSQAIQSGDRSAKIRTYNFPQGRITDHRISQSWFNITTVLEGEVGEIVTTVNTELRKKLQAGEELAVEETD